ncbi:patatin-like phospholipase family protein [Carboxylicivirga sediminis]|uniref:Patatin-like phospholipase family protein n=1 Tax=Carboxylicivirga sediminis TaxID=2006564 RepID=A0A941F6I8_9BACT|nr:patatin-like phospholipase family protein [Carboxylicivirga sediminis]MBR8537442.1 patatin-like phospholipase family protein [Carboxylicivirga sediminis]
MKRNNNNKTVSLVLGSGGARGLAHIGIIRWLLENNYTIHSISGCSIGSVIGGIYAAGQLDKFEEWVRSLTLVDIASYMDISWGSSGLIKGEKLINKLKDLIGDTHIERLPIKFVAVAADVKNEKEVWLSKGNLFDAIRASISLPLFLTPVNINNTELIDGGVLNPIPIAPVFSDSSDLIIAVNLGAKSDALENKPTASNNKTSALWRKNIKEPQQSQSGMYQIADQAFDAMQNAIARQKLAAYPPDYIIEIARNACGTLDFHKADEMIDLGYNKAAELLKDI